MPELQKRLKQNVDWNEKDTLDENYARNQLVADPNLLLGRKAKQTPLVEPEARRAAGEETYSDDDEQRAALKQPRKSGKAPPPRLTGTQREVVKALMDKHGDDTKAMMLDTKLNKMQHSQGELKRLIEAYHFWGPNSKHDFWSEKKPPKKLLNCRILA
ncbi:hypothetical protein HYH02_005233 [Chlamydomonas schloesseri]|uniref:Nucleolar protein 16 n=1 Tax=Chlamydomonas schloesseri TaxID=2026947 RepID=A0A836B768_9CHLO|nr:hypothetical protein HYH02_005233 [Chlamydomonas schloesseri]|eukprot:KAG2449706.1 hypothetical protein HYH02_005233 [Chlamydomonas schloesseri]